MHPNSTITRSDPLVPFGPLLGVRPVPLNQLIDVLINAELARVAPDEIARHFMTLLRIQELRVVGNSAGEEVLQKGEDRENSNSRAEA
jgi:hypothetical protein